MKKKGDFANDLKNEFKMIFNQQTIEIIRELAYDDPPKFVRAKDSQEKFLDKLDDMLDVKFSELGERYKTFVEKFKIVMQ